MLDNRWQMIVSRLDYAMMPIVNVYTGVVFGYEAYLRAYDKMGFSSVADVFDRAYQDKVLYELDLNLRKKALEKFLETGLHNRTVLFYNLDTRVFEMEDYGIGNTKMLLDKYGLPRESFCFEIREHEDIDLLIKSQDLLESYKKSGLNVALDNFSLTLSGSKLLYNCPPQFLKVDAPYLQELYEDSAKRDLVISTFKAANQFQVKVISTEVETEEQFILCKELGSHLVEGFMIQEPLMDVRALQNKYDIIEDINALHHAMDEARNDRSLLYDQMKYLEPAITDMRLFDVFNYFRKNTESTFMPVVDRNHIPLGILLEKTLKSFAYSMYGKEVLMHTDQSVRDFTTVAPTCDINTKIDQLITIFSDNEDAEGIIITENMTYIGFLSARALLKVLHKKNLRDAMSRNPLTNLPGNRMIDEYIENALTNDAIEHALIYLDFDNFKPFNDYYGFNAGDKVIKLFADIMLSKQTLKDAFVGHIGGDDFFIGFDDVDFSEVLVIVQDVLDTFTNRVRSYYTKEDRDKGYIYAKDRDGNPRKFDLLSISASLVKLPTKRSIVQLDDVSHMISGLKKTSKSSPTRMAAVSCL